MENENVINMLLKTKLHANTIHQNIQQSSHNLWDHTIYLIRY